jgi:hypothetical protein
MNTLMLPLMCICAAFGDDDPSAKLQSATAIRNAFEANLHALTSADLSFQFSAGLATDLDSARKGTWKDRSTASGRLAFSGSAVRFERNFPLELLRSHRQSLGTRKFSTVFNSMRLLTDGTRTFYDLITPSLDGSELIHSTQIFGGTDHFAANSQFPFGLAGAGCTHSPLGVYLDLLAGKSDGVRLDEVDENAELDGTQVVKITVSSPGLEASFWVDPDRGALPLKVVLDKPKIRLIYLYDDIRLIHNEMWLPFREVMYLANGYVQEFRIEQITSVNEGLSEATFELTFPKPIGVIDKLAMLAYSPQKTWSLNHLPSRGSRGTISILPQESTGPQLPGEQQPADRSGYLFLAAGALVLVCVAAVYFRRTG